MQKLTTQELGRLSPQGFRESQKFPLILILDNVRSALNVGSVFRTADAFACLQICLCGITATPPHREILKTALGSTESVDWRYFESTKAALQQLKSEGVKVYAVEQVLPRTWLQDFQPLEGATYGLLFGNEVDGVDPALLPLCEGAIEIPQFGSKHSLNIAVAAGVTVWELVKKMNTNEQL